MKCIIHLHVYDMIEQKCQDEMQLYVNFCFQAEHQLWRT